MVVLGLGMLWSAEASWGNELSTSAAGYTVQNWQIEQGLPHISVTSIAQTPDGYLWLGTFNGLARFDGVRFTIFDEGNTPVLGNSAIIQLQVDEQGALWITTLPGGLVRMAAGQFTLALKEEARLLVAGGGLPGGASQRLFLLDRQGNWRQIEKGQVLPLEQAEWSATDRSPLFLFENTGGTWVAQQGKIARSTQGPFSGLIADGSHTNRVAWTMNSAAASRLGGYWLATEDGIYRLREGHLSARLAGFPSGVTPPIAMMEDGEGNLWAGKWGRGIYRMEAGGSWQQFSVGQGLADNYVNCLFRDREGSLWVGTGQGGLHQFRPRVFRMFDTESGMGSNVVMSVTQDHQGRMWFGVNGSGLHTWTRGRLTPVREPALWRSYPLTYSVFADRQDAIWVGLYGLTALRWHDGAVIRYNLDDGSLEPMTPHAIFEDRAGAVWLGYTRKPHAL